MNKRPTGITVLFIVYLILGILSFVWSGLILGIGGISALLGTIFGADNIATFGGANAWSGYVGIITAILQIIVAFGLAGMKRWAWTLALIATGLTLFQGLIGMVSGGIFTLICGSIGILIPAILFFYLLKPTTRAAFGFEQ